MDIEQIEQELTVFNKKYPFEAMEAAISNQAEITPILLNALDKAIDEKEDLDKDYFLHALGKFLLAQFKETLAFPKLVKLLEMDGNSLNWILSDTLSEEYHAILFSTFNGDLQLLKNIIENDYYYVFARGAALSAYENLVLAEEIKAEDWQIYLSKLLAEQNDATFKSFVVEMIENSHFYDLIPEVRKEYTLGKIDTEIGSYSNFINRIFNYRKNDKEIEITDAIAMTRNWHCFEKEESKKPESVRESFDFEDMQKALYPTPTLTSSKIGRNEVCPCGSGKKYKKCCLDKKDAKQLTPYEEALLQFYPKENQDIPNEYLSFYDYFDKDALALDRLICIGMRGIIPIYPASREEKIDTMFRNLKKAYTLFLSKMEAENFTNFAEFDDKYQVHYQSEEWLEKFARMIENYEQENLLADLPSIDEVLDKYRSNTSEKWHQESLAL